LEAERNASQFAHLARQMYPGFSVCHRSM